MENKLDTFFKSIRPVGLLSFGLNTEPVELEALNVLIGPNASGKSNFVDILHLIRSLPSDHNEEIRNRGGVAAWLWNGANHRSPSMALATIDNGEPVSHLLGFARGALASLGEASRLALYREQIAQEEPQMVMYELERFSHGKIRLDDDTVNEDFRPKRIGTSILAQISSWLDYPTITSLGEFYRAIRIYDMWHFGRESALRRSQSADQRGDRLEEDYSNLALVLNQMGTAPEAKQNIVNGLKELYEGFSNYEVVVNSGSVQIFFTEGNRYSVPATRLSDGTLRYLCLLAILYNPNPPPVVCIEEPELGLHPDIVAGLAKHLRAASDRMQLIVTTHSDILVDALSDVPESIIVCENVDGATQMKRLEPDLMEVWLQKYRLGELWISGQLGGNRW